MKNFAFFIIGVFTPLLLVGCWGESINDSKVTSLSLSTSSATLEAGTTSYVVITAQTRGEDNEPLNAVTIDFSSTLGRLEDNRATTNGQGEAKIKLFADNAAGEAIVSAFVNGYQEKVSITIDSGAQNSTTSIGGLELKVLNDVLPADGISTTAIDAVVTDKDDKLLAGRNIQFGTNAGTLLSSLDSGGSTTLSVTTDAQGSARLFVKSSTTSTVALISANAEGVNAVTSLTFSPGIADSINSSMVASPSSIPANGDDKSEVIVLLLDANSNLVADETVVTLHSTAGVITSTNPQRTILGRAVFTLQSATIAAVADLTILEYPGITNQVTFGSTSSPDPANIEVSVANPALFVAGVGKKDNSSLTVTVKTASGNLIADADIGVNNLKIRFKTKPNGGEKLIGTDANSNIVESDTELSIRTLDGVASLTLQAGTLPGVIEFEVEALNPDGSTPSSQIIATLSQVTIASGPPHNIVLSYPVKDSVEDLGAGIYRRVGSASVTDRYGNSVPDGTAISLGLLDSVISSNRAPSMNGSIIDSNASIISSQNALVDNTNSNIDVAAITRNNTSRVLQANDRVLIFNAQAGDKSRFISNASSAIQSNSFEVNKNYFTSTSSLEYLAGAALLGGQISGINALSEEIQTGQATTESGLATFYVTYPSDKNKILTGCFREDPTLDLRHQPAGSAQVWLIAESNETGATTIDNRFCYGPVEDYELANISAIDTISSTTDISFELRDANQVPLPFLELGTYVDYETNTGALNVTVSNCMQRVADGINDTRTDEDGTCELQILVTGGASSDTATVSISAPGNAESVSISVAIP